VLDLVDAPPGVAPAGRATADASDVDTGLAVVADVLRVSVRTTDRVARTAPRRFAVLLTGEHGYVLDTAERLHRTTRRGLRRLGLAPRVGIALRPPEDCDGPPQEWLDGLLDEAAGSVRYG
jgi:GGDEF domain-containing protein